MSGARIFMMAIAAAGVLAVGVVGWRAGQSPPGELRVAPPQRRRHAPHRVLDSANGGPFGGRAVGEHRARARCRFAGG